MPCHVRCSLRQGHEERCSCGRHPRDKEVNAKHTQMDTSSEEDAGEHLAMVIVEEITGALLLTMKATNGLKASEAKAAAISRMKQMGIHLRGDTTHLWREGRALSDEAILVPRQGRPTSNVRVMLVSGDYIVGAQVQTVRWATQVQHLTSRLGTEEVITICDHFAEALGVPRPTWVGHEGDKRTEADRDVPHLAFLHTTTAARYDLLLIRTRQTHLEVIKCGTNVMDPISTLRHVQAAYGQARVAVRDFPEAGVNGGIDTLLLAAQLIAMYNGKVWSCSKEAQLVVIIKAFTNLDLPLLIPNHSPFNATTRRPLLNTAPYSTTPATHAYRRPVGLKICPFSPGKPLKQLCSNHEYTETTLFLYVDLREKLWPDGAVVMRAFREQNVRKVPLLVIRASEGSLFHSKHIVTYEFPSTARETVECGKDARWLIRVAVPGTHGFNLDQVIRQLYHDLPWNHTEWLEGVRQRFEYWLAIPPAATQ